VHNQTGGQDARVIEYEKITLAQEAREFVEARVLDRAGASIEDQHPRLIARLERLAGDQILGQVVFELGESHGAGSIAQRDVSKI